MKGVPMNAVMSAEDPMRVVNPSTNRWRSISQGQVCSPI